MIDGITIGELTLSRSQNGTLWLMYQSGEGMVVDEAKLLLLLEKFYAENF